MLKERFEQFGFKANLEEVDLLLSRFTQAAISPGFI